MRPFTKLLATAVITIAVVTSVTAARAATAEQCQALVRQDFSQVPDAPTRITTAAVVTAAGPVPAYCRVEANIAPQVGFEGHLPLQNWNGKFVFQGCGGMCGNMGGLSSCPEALSRGYACATTDMGHKGLTQDGRWAYQNPIAEIDVGHRATHVATVAGKAIVEALYAAPIKRSYFRGCSTGGRQALVEANRYPYDFDGIIGGAPVLYSVMGPPLQLFWNSTANLDANGEIILPASKMPMVAKAVIGACDDLDGLKDGIINDPRQCNFDAASLKCGARGDADCLTEAEISVVQKFREGPRNSKGILKRVGGSLPGTEFGWQNYFGRESGSYGFANDNVRYLAFALDPGPSYDVSQFNWDRDPQRLSYSHMSADNPDLGLFAENGGKLILFHGWSDPSISASSTILYYEKLTRTMGGEEATKNFAKLYLQPGMGHCQGGYGVSAMDLLGALDTWVEQGRAPDEIIAYAVPNTGPISAPAGFDGTNIAVSKPRLSRPLYPYPEMTRYSGSGDVNAASSFTRTRSAQ